MVSLKSNLLQLGGLCATGIVSTAILGFPAGGLTSAALKTVEALAPNFGHQFLSGIEYGRFKDFLIRQHPDNLNHDLERLVKDALLRAVGYIKRLYIEQLESEAGLSLIAKYTNYPFDEIKTALSNLEKDLKSELDYQAENESIIETNKRLKLNLKDYLLDKSDDTFTQIADYVFSVSGLEDEAELLKIKEFFKAELPRLFDLSYKEALKHKDNEVAFKAFQIWLLEEGFRQNQQLLQGQTWIIEILLALKQDFNSLKNASPKLPHHLTLPPLVPEVFEGRTDELQNIKKALFEGENLLLLVNGEGGIGKTSLAAKYYQQYAHAYKHLAWVLCEQSIADALLTLALPLKLQFDDTATTDQRLAVLLQQMVNLDKPCLLIIDNANEVADLDKNYRLLRQCPNFHILLTSRINAYKNAKFFKIDSLPPEQALAVFREHYPKLQATEEPIFEGIYTAVGGNTLVLELLAKNVTLQNTLKTKYSLASLLADLQTKGLLQIVEDDAVPVEYQSYQTAKPTEVIAAMYDLSKLSEAESRLLSIFAVLPAENIVYETLEALLPQTPNLDKTLLSLAQKGWLNHNTTDSSFKCSPVIQEITQTKNQNLYTDCEEMIEVLIDKLEYEASVGTLRNATYEEGVLYARFAESVIANLEEIEYNLAWLCERIGNFYKTHGNIEKGIIYFENYSIISEKLVEHYPENETFKNSLAISYSKLGELQQSLGNLDKALEYFEKDCQITEELYRDYPNQVSFKNGLAISYEKLGDLQQSLGNLDKALTFFEDETTLFEELYRDYPNQVSFKNGLAISYERLGALQKSLGNLEKALEYFEKRNQIGEELYRDYPNQVEFKNNLAISYQKIGSIFEEKKNFEEAANYYEQYKKLEFELNRDYPNQVEFIYGLATSCIWLGDAQKALNKMNEAKSNFQAAVTLLEDLYQKVPIPQYQKQLNWVKNALEGLGG